MDDTTVDLDAIRARADKASTPGPWVVRVDADGNGYQIDGPDGQAVAGTYDWEVGGIFYDGDAEFIAYARTDVPALLAEVSRLRTERDTLAAAAESVLGDLVALTAGGILGVDPAQYREVWFNTVDRCRARLSRVVLAKTVAAHQETAAERDALAAELDRDRHEFEPWHNDPNGRMCGVGTCTESDADPVHRTSRVVLADHTQQAD